MTEEKKQTTTQDSAPKNETTADPKTTKKTAKTKTAPKKTRKGPMISVKVNSGTGKEKIIKMTKDEYHKRLYNQRVKKKELKQALNFEE